MSVIEKLFEKSTDQYGTIRIENWPEGLVLWVGGWIRWKSWVHDDELRAENDRLRARVKDLEEAAPLNPLDVNAPRSEREMINALKQHVGTLNDLIRAARSEYNLSARLESDNHDSYDTLSLDIWKKM